ncbi:MFS transporter [Erwinia sp. OLTSP20]|uniref:MFS transporter n=1 Tax=unclassified Erwinia TaxID=2622719 RepID=UPI000C19B92E|nr:MULTISPECIES: MFS transporter [unclassified Erwinia]PIJ49305.1 MFS transporter [Erwinia sp. OAMSP11]PIJ70570.1 MFS transporter [Erwinia sp. OLSSP12]PIJ79983.1 MFS transporter [Erwinia sp. OLCASP19]PIJ81771.1 MFS transporter [Erwinia sp. OLMTSP26]PIJ84721.1 MFS transporter [Erwinia sp. OLMDSP33]
MEEHTATYPTHSPVDNGRSVRWYVFAGIFAIVVVNFIDRTALSIAMPTIAKEFALSPVLQGLILSAFFWSYALLQIPGGWLLDRFGARATITTSTVGWGLFQTLAAFTTGGISLLLCRVGLGAFEAPLFPAGAKLNAAWLPPHERGRGASIMDCGAPLGAAIGGAIIAGLIAIFDSWRIAFAVAGIATVLLGYAAWKLLRDTPALHGRVSAAELAIIEQSATNETNQPHAYHPPAIKIRSIIAILVGRMSWAMINFGLLTWGPSYLAQARHLNLKELGGATFVMFGAGMLGSLCSGFLADRLQTRGVRRPVAYKSLLGISGAGLALAFVMLPQVTNVVGAVALLTVTQFFLWFGSLYWSLPALLAPKERVGLVGSMMNFAGSASGIAIPIIAGYILQQTGTYEAVILFFAACAGVYMLATLAIAIKE